MASDHNLTMEVENNNDFVDETGIAGDELIVEMVRTYPHLYNKKESDYKDEVMKLNSWSEIGEATGLGAEYAMKRWKTLRDRYSKELRIIKEETRSGKEAPHRRPFFLYRQMQFLQPFITPRKTVTNFKGAMGRSNEKFKLPFSAKTNLSQNVTNSKSRMKIISISPSPKPSIKNVVTQFFDENHSSSGSSSSCNTNSTNDDDTNNPLGSEEFHKRYNSKIRNGINSVDSPSSDLGIDESYSSCNTNCSSSNFSGRNCSIPLDRKFQYTFPSLGSERILESEESDSSTTSQKKTAARKTSFDEVDKSFMDLSSAITNHLKNKKEREKENENDECGLFASFVSSRLKSLNEPMRTIKMKKITDILFSVD